MGTGTRVKELHWTGDTGAQHWAHSATQFKKWKSVAGDESDIITTRRRRHRHDVNLMMTMVDDASRDSINQHHPVKVAL